MKNLSFWAMNNPVKARMILALAHILGALNAVVLGILLYDAELGYSPWLMLILANVFFLAFFFYPRFKAVKGWFRYTYVRQKVHDFTLVFSAILAIALMVNNFLSLESQPVSSKTGNARLIVHKGDFKPEAKVKKGFRSELRKKAKQLRKNIKAEIKEIKKIRKNNQQGGSNAGLLKALLIMLTIAVAVTLGTLVAALACDLSCSGYEGLALITLILGWGGIIWLGIIAIKNIIQKVGRGN